MNQIKESYKVSTLWNRAGIARLDFHTAPRQTAVKGGTVCRGEAIVTLDLSDGWVLPGLSHCFLLA